MQPQAALVIHISTFGSKNIFWKVIVKF